MQSKGHHLLYSPSFDIISVYLFYFFLHRSISIDGNAKSTMADVILAAGADRIDKKQNFKIFINTNSYTLQGITQKKPNRKNAVEQERLLQHMENGK